MSGPAADAGGANERTALAWQRTALAVVAGSAVVARLTWRDLAAAALVPLVASMVLGLWIFAESRGRYAHDAGTRPRSRPRGGRAPTALAVATVLLAGTELAALAR